MTKRSFCIVTMVLLWAATAWGQRDTYFFSGFEYDDEPFVIAPSDLNGADDQVGEFSGETDFPEASGGDILEQPDSAGFADNPFDGGRLLLIDRPGGDIENDLADFQGSFFADLTETILLTGAEVSFDVATRRTGGNNNKDYYVVGRASDGEETFRLRMGTNNNGGERLGVVVDGVSVFDLPTIEGDDRPADLDNTGGFPLQTNDELASVTLSLGPESYSIDFAHDEQNTSPQANAYSTSAIGYNGPGQDLAQVEIVYSGSQSTGVNSGFVIDNLMVTGFEELLQGDFDFNGELDMGDFLVLAENFGEFTADGDYDFDGDVDLSDFIGFKAAFNAANAPAGAAAVPEPSAGLLLLTALLALAHRRRR